MQRRQVVNGFEQVRAVVDRRTEHHLRVNFDAVFDEMPQLFHQIIAAVDAQHI